MRQDWIDLASRPVPRYTSYPPATAFTDAVTTSQVATWAGNLDPDAPISVYAHIPFCERLCWYCGCHTSVPNGYGRIAAYMADLHREIDLWSGHLSPHGGAAQVHLGGGSPNALSAEDLSALLAHLRRAFGVRDDAEVAVELDPRSLDADRLSALGASGVTRASLGVQTLSPRVQAAINRVQPASLIEAAVEGLRAVGVRAVNMDLMYGLPHQTVADLEAAADFAADMGADRIAVFGYAHVPWFARHQKAIDETALPDVASRADQAETIAERLLGQGYVAVGFDHFARPDDPLAQAAAAGTLRRNFQGYTDDPCDTLIGLGTSAISSFAQGFAQTAKDVRVWRAALDARCLPIVRGVALKAEDRLRGAAIERLMCRFEVDLGALCAEFGIAPDTLDSACDAAAPLAVRGLCRIDGRRLTVPPAARPLVRLVAQCLDAHAPPAGTAEPARHARAV